MWGFMIIRDSNIDPQIEGFPYNKDPNKVHPPPPPPAQFRKPSYEG